MSLPQIQWLVFLVSPWFILQLYLYKSRILAWLGNFNDLQVFEVFNIVTVKTSTETYYTIFAYLSPSALAYLSPSALAYLSPSALAYALSLPITLYTASLSASPLFETMQHKYRKSIVLMYVHCVATVAAGTRRRATDMNRRVLRIQKTCLIGRFIVAIRVTCRYISNAVIWFMLLDAVHRTAHILPRFTGEANILLRFTGQANVLLKTCCILYANVVQRLANAAGWRCLLPQTGNI